MQLPRCALGLSLALVAAPAGCGDNAGVSSDPSFTIAVHAPGAALVAVRPSADPDGAWQAVALAPAGDAEVELPGGPYAITTVCDAADRFRYQTYEAGPTDPRVWDLSCAAPPATVEVTVEYVERRHLFIGDQIDRSGVVTIAPGTYDLAMVDRTGNLPRVGVRRGVAIDASKRLAFDLGDESGWVRPVDLDVEEWDDTFGGATVVQTAGGTRYDVPLDRDAQQAYLIPAPALAEGDVQTVLAFDRDDREHGFGDRTMKRVVTGEEEGVAIELPEQVLPTMWWDPTPHAIYDLDGAWDDRRYELAQGETRVWQVRLLPGAGTDELQVPDPASVPGWDPTWATDHEFSSWTISLTARPSPEVELTTSWNGSFEE